MSKASKYWFPVYSNQDSDPVGYLDIIDNEDLLLSDKPRYYFEFHLITDRQFEDVGFSRYLLDRFMKLWITKMWSNLKNLNEQLIN